MWYQTKIESLTHELGKKEAEIERLSRLVEDQVSLKAQVAAKDQALGARIGSNSGDIGPLPDVAWGLLWQEYWRRKGGGGFQFQAIHGCRSKQDAYANTWSLQPLPNLSGLSEEHQGIYIKMAEQFGYDPHNPPTKDYILLHCFPNKAAYEMAKFDLEKSQEDYKKAFRSLQEFRQAAAKARERGRFDLAEKNDQEADVLSVVVSNCSTRFEQCKEVMANAIQVYYLIPMDAFEKMDLFGVPVQCQTITVIPQKRHQNLPEMQVEPLAGVA